MSQTFVVVDIQVVWSREDGDEGGETCSLTLPVHTIPEERETNKPPTLELLNMVDKKKRKKKDLLQRSLQQTGTG